MLGSVGLAPQRQARLLNRTARGSGPPGVRNRRSNSARGGCPVLPPLRTAMVSTSLRQADDSQTREVDQRGILMPRTIRLQGDSNAHDRPWRVAVERGYFADEGLDVEYHEDNPQGIAGRVENFSERWKESQLQKGALEVYPVCEWGAIEL